jgi:hypothetical protein
LRILQGNEVALTGTSPTSVTLDEYIALCNAELRRQKWFADGMRFQRVPLGSNDPSGVDYVCADPNALKAMVELDASLARRYVVRS